MTSTVIGVLAIAASNLFYHKPPGSSYLGSDKILILVSKVERIIDFALKPLGKKRFFLHMLGIN